MKTQVCKNKGAALQKSKHGTRELRLQIEFEIKVNETDETNIYIDVIPIAT